LFKELKSTQVSFKTLDVGELTINISFLIISLLVQPSNDKKQQNKNLLILFY